MESDEANHVVLFVFSNYKSNGICRIWIAQLKNMMLEEKGKGNTVIFSTHLLSFAEEIADDLLVLHEGEIIILGR
ncbi:hypothetical protein P9436_05150 [Lysinibacillus capsici]|uniref:hypothetical protein n=1 Tax=Lysinibacillus capsici TaxID=2115968 RepID=UPI002E24E7D1|nr:hypothetical protein [Lysinibacillus capsici]